MARIDVHQDVAHTVDESGVHEHEAVVLEIQGGLGAQFDHRRNFSRQRAAKTNSEVRRDSPFRIVHWLLEAAVEDERELMKLARDEQRQDNRLADRRETLSDASTAGSGKFHLRVERSRHAAVLVAVEVELHAQLHGAKPEVERLASFPRGRDGKLDLDLRRDLVAGDHRKNAVVAVHRQQIDALRALRVIRMRREVNLVLPFVGNTRIVGVEGRGLRRRIDQFQPLCVPVQTATMSGEERRRHFSCWLWRALLARRSLSRFRAHGRKQQRGQHKRRDWGNAHGGYGDCTGTTGHIISPLTFDRSYRTVSCRWTTGGWMAPKADLLQGTLDLLILRTL